MRFVILQYHVLWPVAQGKMLLKFPQNIAKYCVFGRMTRIVIIKNMA